MAITIRDVVEQTLTRVLSHLYDDTMNLAWNLADDLLGIQVSTIDVIDMLEDAEKQLERSRPVMLWLIKLQEVAYEAEDVLDELSYEILLRKVHNNSSLGRIRFLKNVVFNFQLARKVKNLNRSLQMINDEAENHLRLSRTFNGYLEPLRFRPCYRFCLSIPKDFPVQKIELIQLWMAAGLLQSYDEGNDCFKVIDSLHRSLQDEEKNEDDNVVLYKIQGLKHEHESLSECNRSCICYLCATTSVAIPKNGANMLRTLILDGVPFQESWKLERLMILVFLNSVDMEMLPSSIGRMKHLRYLDVSNTRIRALPDFITELYNLKTLRFLKCKELNELPKQFNNLINLKSIAFSFEHQMPFGLGLLTDLETLSFFVVGSDRGGSIEELRYLNGLRGHLEITRLEEVRDRKEAKRANIQQKEKIDGLGFQWSSGAYDRSSSDEELLEGLRPHPQIRKIKIKYYMGENWPSWMLRTTSPSTNVLCLVNSLVSLTSERCWNCIQLPCLGDLPHLEFLTMQHINRVKCIYNELNKEIDSEDNDPLYLFPALKSSSLSWMKNLTEWCSNWMIIRWLCFLALKLCQFSLVLN